MTSPADRSAHPSTPAPLPDPGIRFRLVYRAWRNCADWQTRGSLVRVMLAQWRRRIFPPVG